MSDKNQYKTPTVGGKDPYDFDTIIDRRNTGALKTDALLERYGSADLLPMWVADMDFATPPFVIDAMRERLQHPVMGYTVEHPDWRHSIIDWLRDLHGLGDVDIRPEWLCFIPGIVKGIGLAVEVFTKPGDKVIIQPPVYHPFRLVPEADGREVVFNPLRRMPDGGYEMDFENLEKVADRNCGMLILSSPHNPVGIVWNKETLCRLATFCHKRGIIVISDEIHSEMLLGGRRHHPFWSVSREAADCSVTFAAPTKTFNMAGIVSSYSIVVNDTLREKFYGFLKANELDEPTLLAPIATVAAYRKGAEWRRRMLRYVEGNVDMVIEYCRERIPAVRPLRPQASFLVWLDCSRLGLGHDSLMSLFIDGARLALNDGEMFGPGGEGFMRLNVGAPRSVVLEALRRIEEAIARLNLND